LGTDNDLQELTIHDRRVAFRTAGSGPVVLLIHGMAGSSTTWKYVMPVLSKEFTVVAPDLIGAFASMLRDLLVALGHERATVVGQSLGGGIAMQLAYQHPQHCERLALVGSGGLGREVNPVLRLLTFPGADSLLRIASAAPVRSLMLGLGSVFGRAGMQPAPATGELWRSYESLADDPTRKAFLRTLRAVIDPKGQAVSAENRLHLAAGIEGSRLEIVEGVGHYPHCEAPERFVEVLTDFIESTIPAQISISPEHVLRSSEN